MIELNYVLFGFLIVYLARLLLDIYLENLNLKHLKKWGNQVPQSFEGFIDASKLATISSYTLQKSRLAIREEIVSQIILLAIILSGFLPALQNWMEGQAVPFMLSGLLFFLLPGVILYVIELPFDYHHTFRIEERFAFNRSTMKTWVTDHLKGGIISVLLAAVLLVVVLWTIKTFPQSWWFWGFLMVSLIQIALTVLYPILIAPVFNKFRPIDDDVLAEKIKELMATNGIRVKKILQMDAGRRSRHTNAYFTGFGKTKQIVLFDTLLESHPSSEILAVLAHEAGHYKKKHILKQVFLFELSMLVGFYLTYLLMDWRLLYTTFGFADPLPYIGLFFIAIFWQQVGYFVKPLYMSLSRRFERQADLFAADLMGTVVPLTTAFKRMAADNLSNLNPHPLYVSFSYTHPPLMERVSYLEQLEKDREFFGAHQGARS